jgi:hypothetical protein
MGVRRASVDQAHGWEGRSQHSSEHEGNTFIRDVEKTVFYHKIKNPKMRVVLSTDLSKVRYGVAAKSIEAYGGMKM